MKVIYIIKPRYFMHQERTELNILNCLLSGKKTSLRIMKILMISKVVTAKAVLKKKKKFQLNKLN